MDKSIRRQIFYQESCNERRQYESMLFQRLNYYLVAVAFLIAAFVQLAVSKLVGLALLVGGTGVGLSWLYTAINYHNARIMSALIDDTAKLEENFFNDMHDDISAFDLPYARMKIELSKNKYKFDLNTVLWDTIQNISFSFNYKRQNNKKREVVLSPHTWMIPYLFILFWLLALIVYIAFYLTPNYGWFVPLVFFVYVAGVPAGFVIKTNDKETKNTPLFSQSVYNRNKIKVYDVFLDVAEMIILATLGALTWTSTIPLFQTNSTPYRIVLGIIVAYLLVLLAKLLRKYVFGGGNSQY